MNFDPTRLFEDPNAATALQADLARAATATVQGVDFGAGLASLHASLAATTGAAPIVATAATSSGLLAKACLTAVLLGGAAVVAWVMIDDTSHEANTNASGDDVVFEAEVPNGGKVVLVAAGERELVLQPGAPAQVVAAPAVQPSVEPALAEPALAEPALAEPFEVSSTLGSKRPHRRAVAKSPKRISLGERLVDEAQMVADARRALGTNPATALRLVQDAVAQFPNGQLKVEREAVAISALQLLGRTDAARTRGEAFLRKYSTGPHADAVRRAISR